MSKARQREEHAAIWGEDDVALEIGVVLSAVQAHRREALFEDEHWIRKNGAIMLTEKGRAACRAHFGLTASEVQDVSGQGEVQKNGGTAAAANPVVAPSESEQPACVEKKAALVLHRLYVNKTRVQGRLADGALVDVIVARGRQGMRPGMTLDCRQRTDGQWEFCGRYPRRG